MVGCCKLLGSGLLHSYNHPARSGHSVPVQFSSVAQSYPTLCDPMDCSLPGSSIHGIFQARALEWGAIALSKRKLSTEELMLLNCDVGEDS